MEFEGRLLERNGDTGVFEVSGINWPDVNKRASGRVVVYLEEKDDITDLQRNHIMALIGDISEYEGYPIDAVKANMQYGFMLDEDLDEYPSIARGAMKKSVAGRFIEYLILYCIGHGIPFRKQQFYLTTDTNKMLFALTMKRLCIVCGKKADMHHASNLVGMGNKRSQHKHEDSTFMALCRGCHTEIHQIGYTEFCKRHYVKAIKLDRDQLKEIRVI